MEETLYNLGKLDLIKTELILPQLFSTLQSYPAVFIKKPLKTFFTKH